MTQICPFLGVAPVPTRMSSYWRPLGVFSILDSPFLSSADAVSAARAMPASAQVRILAVIFICFPFLRSIDASVYRAEARIFRGEKMDAQYLPEAISQLRGLKKLAEKALAQVSDEGFFAVLDPESNSVALIVKHIAGNLRSRWTDFLMSDGEKPDRHRDAEFLAEESDTRQSLESRWQEAWKILFEALEPLSSEDL